MSRQQRKSPVVLVALIIVLVVVGCIPSPNAPLGAEQQDATTAQRPPAAPAEPIFQPAVTDEAATDSQTASTPTLTLPELTAQPNDSAPLELPAELPAADEAAVDAVPPSSSVTPLAPATVPAAEDTASSTADVSPLLVTPLGLSPSDDRPPIGELQLAPAPDSHSLENRPVASLALDTPLIPRERFFGNPERTMARLSPDGELLAFLAPYKGVLNVYVASTDNPENARPVTDDEQRGIRRYFWAYTSRHILYRQDDDGDEDFHVYSVNLDTEEIRDLTPLDNIAARVLAVSPKQPAEILVGLNDRPPHQLHDVHQINIVTGEHHLVLENPGYAGFEIDDDYQVRFAVKFTDDGGQPYVEADDSAAGGWRDFMKFGPEDAMTSGFEGFNKTADQLYFIDSRRRNTGALKLLDLATGRDEIVTENDKADVSGTLIHPTEKHVQAVTFNYDRRKWKVLDSSIDADLEYLHTVDDGEIDISSRTLDDSRWTVVFEQDNRPAQHYLYNRKPRASKFLFSSRPDLDGLPLVRMHPQIITASDGLEMVSYLSLPAGSDLDEDARPRGPLPMVLLVHGGPWSRDVWGYNPVHQLMANRGYAVLSVNYRGSTGFGKEFINAANGQWAGRMHDDLLDAVQFAVAEGIADRNRIAIMGGSYGGYAALVGLTFSPDVFACAVDIVGPSNLVTLLENPPPDWPVMPVLKNRVGDHQSPAGHEDLMSRSPLTRVDRIQRPLLIGQGAQDPRVKQAESDQIVAAMRQRGIPVTYMLYPQEGHGFQRPENRLAFYAVAEAFLAKHLGGRHEPIGNALDGAVFDVPAGREQIPGL